MSTLDSTLRTMIAEIVREELARRQTTAPEFVTVDEYARRHAVSKSTVRAAIRVGTLTAKRIGRAIRIPARAEIGRPAAKRSSSATERARLRLLKGSTLP
jgi:excisionase family DNA binding protein